MMKFFKKGRGKGGGGDKELPKPPSKPVLEPIQNVSFSDLGLTAEDVAKTNQELSANYGKKVALNATKLDTNITLLQMELHKRGFDIVVTGQFALQVMIEESRRAYNKSFPEPPLTIALVIEAERRIRAEKGYSEKYQIDSEEVNDVIGEMKEQSVGRREIDRVAKLAADSPHQTMDMQALKMKLLEEAQHLARADMARERLGLEKGARLPYGVFKEYRKVEVPPDVMKRYFEIAKKKYLAMHGLDEKGRPKKKK